MNEKSCFCKDPAIKAKDSCCANKKIKPRDRHSVSGQLSSSREVAC
jgi:hypothetical protein